MKRFAVGDVHGNYKGLQQALARANFDPDNDLLISVGDLADGYSEVPEVIDYVMGFKNFVWCLGNHDEWTQKWFAGKMPMQNVGRDGRYSPTGGWDEGGIHPDADIWLSQGGRATYVAYMQRRPELLSKHREFWIKKPKLYHVEMADQDSKPFDGPYTKYCFVHAGWERDKLIANEARRVPYFLYWDREFWRKAMSCGDHQKLNTADNFEKVFIGHTSTNFWDSMEPMKSGGVWNIDTGGGWTGKVTVIDIDSEEYYQSDLATELYPDERPRR
jgi:serine/threonine protein phosphatase 1